MRCSAALCLAAVVVFTGPAARAQEPVRDRWGMTPLHRAAAEGCLPCVDKLLAEGASPMDRRADGGTPLHRARPAVRARLIAAGADPTARDDLGRTPLMTAAAPGEELLVAGVNTRDRLGFTTLHWAALAGADAKLRWLLAQGADPTLRSTVHYEHFQGVLAPPWDQAIPFGPGQRALDLARFMHDRVKWSTSRYANSVAVLEAATPSRLREWLGSALTTTRPPAPPPRPPGTP